MSDLEAEGITIANNLWGRFVVKIYEDKPTPTIEVVPVQLLEPLTDQRS